MKIYYSLKEIENYPLTRELVLLAKMLNADTLFISRELYRHFAELGKEYDLEVRVYNGETPVITVTKAEELLSLVKENMVPTAEVQSYRPGSEPKDFKSGLRYFFKAKY